MTNYKSDKPQVSVKTIASDEMFTVRRVEQIGRAPVADQAVISFREQQVLRLMTLENMFAGDGWPPLWKRVFVSGEDANEWGEAPDEWEAAWNAEGIDPLSEVLDPTAPHRIELGVQFIQRRVKLMSIDYWLLQEAIAIRQMLDAPDSDQALEAAHALGELRQQANLHGLHLASIKTGKNVRKQLAKSRETATKNSRQSRDERRKRVCQLASETSRTGGALMSFIQKQLEKEGVNASPSTLYRDLEVIKGTRRK